GQGTLDLSEDSKYSGNSVEFLQPHACSLVQGQAHTLERSIRGPAGGHVQLVVAEGFFNDVKSGVQFREFISCNSKLGWSNRGFEGAIGVAYQLEFVQDHAVTAGRKARGVLRGIAEPTDLRTK